MKNKELFLEDKIKKGFPVTSITKVSKKWSEIFRPFLI